MGLEMDRMNEQRFRLGYVCGDFGLIDNAQSEGNQWIDLCSMSENSVQNAQIFINKMNELEEENKQLKKENWELKLLVQNWEALDEEKEGQLDKQNQALKKLKKENEQLQQELFESEEDYLMINYDDNPVRRDAKIELLKEEFKERFGRDFE